MAGIALAGPAAAADGAALYQANCASCHAADGSADTPVGKAMNVPALKPTAMSAEEIAKYVQESDKHKGPAGKLSPDELKAIGEAVLALSTS